MKLVRQGKRVHSQIPTKIITTLAGECGQEHWISTGFALGP